MGKPTGDQAVAAAHAHERGYLDYRIKGLTARNPYDPTTQQFSHERWRDGYEKARASYVAAARQSKETSR